MATDTRSESTTDEPLAAGRTPRAYEEYAWVLVFAGGLAGFLVGLWEFFVGPLDTTAGFTADAAFFRAHLFFLLGFSLLGAVIAAVPYRRREQWAWYTLWVAPVVVLGDAAMNYDVGGTIWPVLLLLAALLALGLLLPVRIFLPGRGD